MFFPFQLSSCRPVVMQSYIGLARGMESQLWWGISFHLYSIMCIFASGYQGKHFEVSFRLSLTRVAFSHLYHASTDPFWHFFSGLALFLSSWFGAGGNTLLRFFSFPRFVFCGRKNAGFLSNPTFGRVICFFGRWASSLKAQIALMMRKYNLMFV